MQAKTRLLNLNSISIAIMEYIVQFISGHIPVSVSINWSDDMLDFFHSIFFNERINELRVRNVFKYYFLAVKLPSVPSDIDGILIWIAFIHIEFLVHLIP